MQAFNPATFLDTTHLGSDAAKRLEQADDVRPSAGAFVGQRHRLAVQAARTPVLNPADVQVANAIRDLEQAAARFAIRRDNFAIGKEATCLDIAAKLQRFGSFASDKQAEFAAKLVEWSKPRQEWTLAAPAKAPGVPVAASQPVAPAVTLPKLFDLMQRLSKLTIGKLVIARKNQDSLCWVKLAGRDGVVGKIEGGKLVLFFARMQGSEAAEVLDDLLMIERDPEAAAALHGKLSGRCSVCSRDLTDPASIERGIGPICLAKF